MLLSELTADIYKKKLRQFLEQQTRPVFESTVMHYVYPKAGVGSSDDESLAIYQYHFALMRLLYQLQEEVAVENLYLHVHFMRIRMLPFPPAGLCREYLEDIGCFCSAPVKSSESQFFCKKSDNSQKFCDHHSNLHTEDDALEPLSIKYFYLSDRNYQAINADNAEAFLNGTWELLYHHDDYLKAVRILELPEHCTLVMVRQSYYRLAKKYHPDKNSGVPSDDFLKINDAYQTLQKLLSLFPNNKC